MKRWRLEKIVAALLEHGPIPGEQVAELCEASRRSVGRDVAFLKSVGAPIVGEPGRGRGYDLAPAFRHSLAAFSAQDVEARILRAVAQGASAAAFKDAFAPQLPKGLPRSHRCSPGPSVTFDTQSWNGTEGFPAKLELLRQAIEDRTEVEYSASGQRRRLQPLHIRLKDGEAFILANEGGQLSWLSIFVLGDARRGITRFDRPVGVDIDREWARAMRDGGAALRQIKVRVTVDPNFINDPTAPYLRTPMMAANLAWQREVDVTAPSVEDLIRDLPPPVKGLRILDPPGLHRLYELKRGASRPTV